MQAIPLSLKHIPQMSEAKMELNDPAKQVSLNLDQSAHELGLEVHAAGLLKKAKLTPETGHENEGNQNAVEIQVKEQPLVSVQATANYED